MDLNELKKQLYKKDGQFKDRPAPPEELAPGHIAAPEQAGATQWQDNGQKGFYLSVKEKRALWLALSAVVLAAAVIGGWFWWRNFKSFNTDEMSLDIFGQDRVVSGEEVNYIVRYKNNSGVAVSNATLSFSFSNQLMPVDSSGAVKQGDLMVMSKNLGQLAPEQDGQAEFKVRVLGDKDSQQKFTAKLNYRPSNISSDFSNSKEFASTIISVPLVLSFILPDRIVSGQTMNFSLRYLNTSDAAFNDAKLKIEYPEGFIFDSALPSPSDGNNAWSLAEIGSREEGNIIIKGTIAGNEGESKVFKAQIGTQKSDAEFVVYSQTLASPQISTSPLFVEQSLVGAQNNNADIGQDLTYKIKYRNTTNVAIGPVFITVKIDSKAMDPSGVNAKNGFFSSSDNTITWNSSSLPALEQLAAGAEGELEFSLKVKNVLPINKFSDKNFTISTTVKIDSFNIPLALSGTQLAGQNQLVVKINSRLVLAMKGFYADQLILNSGPLPPKVGQKTTYTVYWQVLNVSNELASVAVEAYLPSYTSWEGKIYPANEDIKYDASSGKIIWQIGKLSAGTGFVYPVKQIAFQVGFTPSISQVDDSAVVVQQAKATGDDSFTNVQISASDNALKSDMPDDPTITLEKGKIIQ
ncbi:MAG: hypothetical protein PHT44_01215 [Candidatus Portnoybacteria bacterium]|nr:hypothetical protein [Candidatus Portnoybacteria bacterium]MDD4982777.1 hypothetical protein [Candidatus Portnoybacteria bacterium]